MKPVDAATFEEIASLISQAKTIGQRYYQLTGRPIGMTGEIGEHEAARILGLELAPVREPSIDATQTRHGKTIHIQVKCRAVDPKRKYIGRVSRIKLSPKFDIALLVLLDKGTYDAIEIWEASFEAIKPRLESPGSRSRNERGSLGISQFKSIARKVWPT